MACVDHAERRSKGWRRRISRLYFFFDVFDFRQEKSIANDPSIGVLAVDSHVVQGLEIVLLALFLPEPFEVLLRLSPLFVLRFQSRQVALRSPLFSLSFSYRLRTIGTATRGLRFSPSMISLARSP